jgi:hypothetical protein
MIRQGKHLEVAIENISLKMVFNIDLLSNFPSYWDIFSAIAVQVLIKLFYFFLHGLSLHLSSTDYVKILKGSIAGGLIGAIGCWWIYCQHYRKNRNR